MSLFLALAVSIFLSLIEYIIVAYTFRAESKKYKERKKIKRSLSAVSLSSNDTQMTLAKLDSSTLLSPMVSFFSFYHLTFCVHLRIFLDA